jgi:hypothetical protein
VRIWAIENVHHIIQQERDLTKVSVFCAISWQRICGPLFFMESTLTKITHLIC